MSIHHVDWNAIPWTPVRPGVDRKSFAGDGATLALHRLAPGHEPKPHQHPNEQIVYILAGQIRFHIGGETVLLAAGGLLADDGEDCDHHGEDGERDLFED